jgi:hypothetical protein
MELPGMRQSLRHHQPRDIHPTPGAANTAARRRIIRSIRGHHRAQQEVSGAVVHGAEQTRELSH